MSGMTSHHHKGDVLSTDFSPENAFFLTRLRIGETSMPRRQTITDMAGNIGATGQ
jgi:hypothetical protein